MRVLPAVEEEIRRVVRDARAKDPLITVLGLEHALEKHFNRGFSHQYVSKIADKVARESLIVADRTQIEERMNFTRENYRMMREELLKIVYWTPDDYVDNGSPARPSAFLGDLHKHYNDFASADRLGPARQPELGLGREIALDCDPAADVRAGSRSRFPPPG